MAQLIAALFETRPQAEEALSALIGAGIASDRIRLIGGDGDAAADATADGACSAALRGLRLPEEDASAFAAACGGGGAVLAATLEADDMDEAIRVIETYDPIDLDSRTEEHRAAAGDSGGGADVGAPLAAGLSAGGMGGQTNTGALPGMGGMTDSTHDMGSGDLRTRELGPADMGRSSTTATGARREDERSGAPGALELGAPSDAQSATKVAPGAEHTAGKGVDAKPDLFRRQTTRAGRVRAYARE